MCLAEGCTRVHDGACSFVELQTFVISCSCMHTGMFVHKHCIQQVPARHHTHKPVLYDLGADVNRHTWFHVPCS
jgi:hypothetical protein